jgi:methyl-accepting chemotaxis protein
MKRSLTRHITLIVSILIASILIVVMALVGIRLNATISELIRTENLQIVDARAAELGKLLNTHYQELKILSVQDQITKGDRKQAESYLKSMLPNVSSDISTLLIAWPDGLAMTPAGTYVNVQDRSYFKAIYDENKDYDIGNVAISRATNVPSVILAKAVKGSDGKPKAIVAFEMKMENFSSIVNTIKIGKSGFAWVADQRGLIIAHPANEEILKLDITNADKVGYHGMDALGKQMITNQEGQGNYGQPDGSEMTSYYTKVPNSPGWTLSWTLGLSIASAEIASTVNGLLALIFVISIVGIFISILIVIAIARSIVNPINFVVEAVGSLADGDISLSSVDKKKEEKIRSRKDEIGRLGNSIASLQKSLISVIENIQSSSKQVSQGSQMLSETAQGLSQGANEQAASIEELSASVEELASTVRQNADNTAQADALSQRVARNAEESGKAVSKTVTSMKEIASRISIIEEIASQTNLLALNAAIEAARAGESGKGFAVVASEVRKLAERSAKAAGEINTLSKESVSVAGDAGKLLNELVPDIQKTAELIQEITAASGEQSKGAEQISTGVTQMDMVVQQNASSSEQLAATAEELAGQATSLVESVGFFTTHSDSAASNALVPHDGETNDTQ